MKKIMALVLTMVLMAVSLPSALAATEYMDGCLFAEIGGVEYKFYQVKKSFAKPNKQFKFACYDDNGKALFELELTFDDGIEIGEFSTDDNPYNRSGVTVRLTEYFHEGGWSYDIYEASFHDDSYENSYEFDGGQERGYLYMIVEEEEDDYYYGSFGAAVVDMKDYGYEIYASFVVEAA